nr:DNA polymerase [Tanacetum cinerariifolium]
MYLYISRDDCYYIDTDSVVLSQPLPEELISSSILGMLKLEDQIVKGFFLAPKAYSYYTLEGSTFKKYKGPAKDKVTPEWFEKQYAEPSREACCALALLRAFIEVSSKQDHFEDFLCDGSCRLGSFIQALLGGAPSRIRAARERIEDLEGRQQALRAEQEDLIMRAVTRHGHRGD